ncbi:hypothetical protein QQM79_19910 [Marinobacteraceae bacterium S3BR75-40.1]
MNDNEKETVLRDCAYGFVYIFILLMVLSVFFGKEHVRWLGLTVILIYALFYIVIYRAICKSYKDENKRLKAFGVLARGTFVGAIYYASIICVLLMGWLGGAVIYEN